MFSMYSRVRASGFSVTVSTSSLSVTLSTDLPSYSDFPEPLFVQRKLRSSLHGDGDCALHSVLDGYNNLHPAGSMFKRKEENTEDTMFARMIVVHSLIIQGLRDDHKHCRVSC